MEELSLANYNKHPLGRDLINWVVNEKGKGNDIRLSQELVDEFKQRGKSGMRTDALKKEEGEIKHPKVIQDMIDGRKNQEKPNERERIDFEMLPEINGRGVLGVFQNNISRNEKNTAFSFEGEDLTEFEYYMDNPSIVGYLGPDSYGKFQTIGSIEEEENERDI